MRLPRYQLSKPFIRLSLLLLATTLWWTGCTQDPKSIIFPVTPVTQEDAVLSASLAKAAGGGRVFVVFDDAADPGLVESLGGRVVYSFHLVPAVAATGPADVFSQLATHPRVIRIEPDGQVHAIDAELDNTWGVKHIGAGLVHDGGNKGTGVKVGILDSGIDYTHPDLDANYAGGYDFVNNDTDPMDDNGHGTHVAGTIAGADNDEGVVGVAPDVLLYGVKVLSASGGGTFADVIEGIQWTVENKMAVANFSLGASRGTQALADFLSPYGYQVIPVPVHDCLHLVTGATALDATTILAATDWIDTSPFEGYRILPVPRDEGPAANILPLDGVILMASGYPQTAELVAREGYNVELIDNSELEKAEGSLTCLSLIFRK